MGSPRLATYTTDGGWTAEQFAAPTTLFPNIVAPNNPSVINTVLIAIAPPTPSVATPITTMQVTSVVDDDSVALYGVQSTPVVITILATVVDAFALGEYLIRDVPVFWFTGLGVRLGGLSDVKQAAIALLEVGDQVSIAKTFPNVAGTTIKSEFVEGVRHVITPSGHDVTVFCGPAVVYTQFILNTSTLNTETYGLG